MLTSDFANIKLSFIISIYYCPKNAQKFQDPTISSTKSFRRVHLSYWPQVSGQLLYSLWLYQLISIKRLLWVTVRYSLLCLYSDIANPFNILFSAYNLLHKMNNCYQKHKQKKVGQEKILKLTKLRQEHCKWLYA